MKNIHNKLVRDRIPDLIEQSGKSCLCRTLEQNDYLNALDEKLQEELNEYLSDKTLEELADLLEVIRAVITARGSTYEEIESIRLSKAATRGGFEKRIWLMETNDRSS